MTDSLWPDEGDRAPAGDPVAGDDPVAGRRSDPSVDDADDNAGDDAGDAGAEVDPLTALLAQIWEESKSRPVAVRVARPGEPPIPEPSPSVVSAPSPSDATPEDPPVPEPSPEPEPEPEPEATEDAAPPEPAIDGVGEPGPSGASNSAADAIDGAVISADRAAAPARDKITAEDSAAPAARSWRRRLVSRRMLFGLVPLLLVALAVALVVVGFRIIWGSRDGRLVTRITDSSAPGFEAIVEKTPTDLVLLVGADDSLIAASILAHGSDGTGGVIDVPVQTDVYIAPSPGAIVPVTIETLHRNSGVEPTRVALGELLNLEFDRVVVLDPAQLGALVAAAGSLTVNNPTEIATGRVVAFPKGSIALDGDGVIRYLTASAGTGDALAHSDRVQAFWKALIAASDPSGEVASPGAGLESALGVLAGSRVTFETLPVA
ncbi:MAG: hypothetical protein KGR18_06320, partial [Acidobacteria bacterium]|nr:hypothetical protein [Acidobacteriota bacterium]